MVHGKKELVVLFRMLRNSGLLIITGHYLQIDCASYNCMRYFTKEYISAQLSDDEFDKRNCAYKDELLQILNIALPTVREFIANCNLHDGKINSIVSEKGKIEIYFEYGDNQTGYHKIAVQFFNAITDYNSCVKLPFEILYYEYSYKEKYSLNFINKNFIEWGIQFSDINIIKL